jgi:hypothetical protein
VLKHVCACAPHCARTGYKGIKTLSDTLASYDAVRSCRAGSPSVFVIFDLFTCVLDYLNPVDVLCNVLTCKPFQRAMVKSILTGGVRPDCRSARA